jgi:microcystin-dependent protein
MSYLKNHESWLATDPITNTVMNNFETIYTELAAYLLSHNHDDLYYTKTQMESTYFYNLNDGAGSGLDADLIYHIDGNLHASSFYGLGVPIGLVILWDIRNGAIPSGWLLCDGLNGTIDMRDMIPIGAGDGEYYIAPGTTGGSSTFSVAGDVDVDEHILTIDEIPSHYHTFTDHKNQYSTAAAGGTGYRGGATTQRLTNSAGSSNGHGHPGSTILANAIAAMPYYHALYYIQKMS